MLTLSPRLLSVLDYLRWSEPLYKWRLRKADCPLCGSSVFLSLRSDAFMTRCLKCRANATNLSLIPVIRTHTALSHVDTVWEMSTYGATLSFLKKHIHTVYESEYFSDAVLGERHHGILNQDVQNQSFADESLDLITSNQVFEHVANDLQGYSECFRTLRKGGALIFSVPLYDSPATQQLAEIKNGEITFNGVPEYHSSRLSGPKSALTFWRHSFHDICQRVGSVGFETKLIEVNILNDKQASTYVVYARKPSESA